jgi:YfiR/HmsC-like
MTRAAARAGAVAALLLALAAGAAARVAHAAAQDELELKVKAAFLFNFAKFTTWPPTKLAGADAPLLLCVQGAGPMAAVLQDTVRGRSVGGHAIEVVQAARAEELRRCHVVYVGAAEDPQIEKELAALATYGVLTVHEASITQPGGVIRFFLSDGGRVRFEVNVTAASREQLALSAKLLEVSQVVNR